MGGGAAITNQQEELNFTPLKKRDEPGFDRVVVIMFENRSFDHMLGWLYAEGAVPAGQTFDGLHQGQYANPGTSGESVPAHIYTGPTDLIMAQPDPDPGEFYPHVNTQLFGTIDPESNGDLNNALQAPWNLPKDTAKPTMDGFVKDYIVNSTHTRGRAPTPEEYAVVMGGFSPSMRDAGATGIFNAVNLTTPRQPATWPTVTPAYVPPNPDADPRSDKEKDKTRPLTPPALGLIGILLAKYEPNAPLPENYADAYEVLKKHGDGLFGVRD